MRTLVDIPDADIEKLDALAASTKRSRAATIREAVKGAGGDLESQGVNLVLAFKTGYFKDDPLRASAARGVATALVQDLLVAGDRVAVRAYEFGLWDFQPTDRVTAQIISSSRADPLKTALLAPLLP